MVVSQLDDPRGVAYIIIHSPVYYTTQVPVDIGRGLHRSRYIYIYLEQVPTYIIYSAGNVIIYERCLHDICYVYNMYRFLPQMGPPINLDFANTSDKRLDPVSSSIIFYRKIPRVSCHRYAHTSCLYISDTQQSIRNRTGSDVMWVVRLRRSARYRSCM